MSEGERTQAPTQRRRDEAVKQGNIWQPRELGAAAAVATAALVMMLAGPLLWQELAAYLAETLAGAAREPDDGLPMARLAAQLPVRMPLLLAAAILAVTVGLGIVTTRHVALAALTPKFSRLNPVQGLQRIFSMTGLAGAATAILKLALIGGVAMVVLVPMLPRLANIGDDGGALAMIGDAMTRLLGAAALVMVIIAVVDGAISFTLRERKLMMTLDEVRRESRQENGSPEVKAAIKRAQYAASKRRLQTSLADASVVVVNPVHFAVAMRYRPGEDAAPVVVEKGRLEAAHAIIAVAQQLKIPVIRTPRLARALFFTARIGAPVREELFSAVATILAFVMSFDTQDAEAPPPVFVPPEFDFDEAGARRKPGAALPL